MSLQINVLEEVLPYDRQTNPTPSHLKRTHHDMSNSSKNCISTYNMSAYNSTQSNICSTPFLGHKKSIEAKKKEEDGFGTNVDDVARYIPGAKDIQEYIKNALIFSKDSLTKPCMSARLFAGIILTVHENESQEDPTSTILPSVPILALLRAIVAAELASLQDMNTDSLSDDVKKPTLSFCSFDCSATVSPVDIIEGSNTVLENCLQSLYEVVQQAALVKKRNEASKSTETIEYIKSFILKLERFENDQRYLLLRERSSKAMTCGSWPIARFKAASKYYRNEFEALLDEAGKRSSSMRYRLGDFIGRAIRYHLRRFFNPVPYPSMELSESDEAHVYSKCRSRVHEIIEMEAPEGGAMDTVAADGSISCVVGIALLRIYNFWRLNDQTMNGKNAKYMATFCHSSVSQRGLLQKGETIILTQEDLDKILLDISDCHTVLAGVRACAFVQKLLGNRAIMDAIEDIGGWDKVQHYARMYEECELHYDCPDEAHFSLLRCVSSLVERLDADKNEFIKIEQICEESLRKLWKRFRCGTRNKHVLSVNPHIKVIQAAMKTESKTLFPDLVPAN